MALGDREGYGHRALRRKKGPVASGTDGALELCCEGDKRINSCWEKQAQESFLFPRFLHLCLHPGYGLM